MKLSDGTIINSPIKFLGAIYQRNEHAFAFDFNGHTIRANNVEEAIMLRDEIIELVPEAETIKKDLDKAWEIPKSSEESSETDSSGNAF